MLHIRKDYNKRIQDNENIIPDKEPVMLFRAQDKFSPKVLQYYAVELRREAMLYMNADYEQYTNLIQLAEEVNNHVAEMILWQRKNKKKTKLPDCPPEQLKIKGFSPKQG